MRRLFVGRDPGKTLIRLAILVGTVAFVFRFVLLPIRAQGISMIPTLPANSLRFVNLLAYATDDPARGDIVAIRLAGPSVVYVKRVIGLPGERVRIAQGVVYIDDRPLAEPYVSRRAPWTASETRLGDLEYFVIGDNREMPIESHELGTVERRRLIGKIVF